MFVDQKDESCYVPLNDSLKAPGKLELANSERNHQRFDLNNVLLTAKVP